MTLLFSFLAWLMVLYPLPQENASEANLVPLRTNIVISQNSYKSNNPEIPIKHKELIDCLAFYESGNNPEAVGDSGKAYGVLQFWQSTFDFYSAKYNMQWLDYKNPNDQHILADKMLKEDIENTRHWSVRYNCQKEI